MDFLKTYLKKIGFEGIPKQDFETLSKLQNLHLQTFPFENLNLLFNKEVLLDSESLADKFINKNRGGYCFEQNLVFKRALQEIGFEVRELMARVYVENIILGRTHLCLLVHIDSKRYIADVGFGGLVYPQPLWLDTEDVQKTESGNYKIIKKDEDYLVFIELDEWREVYNFNLNQYYFGDLKVANHYTSTHPDSHFTRELMVSLKTNQGRISLRDFQFSEYQHSELIHKKQLSSVEELKEILLNRFGLSVDEFPDFEQKFTKKLSDLENSNDYQK